jgi:hypothetical protein
MFRGVVARRIGREDWAAAVTKEIPSGAQSLVATIGATQVAPFPNIREISEDICSAHD